MTPQGLVHEVSVVIKRHVPRFVGTWAGGLRGDLAERWTKLEQDRKRFGLVKPAGDTRAPDLVVTLPNLPIAAERAVGR